MNPTTVNLSLVSHTNVGKTTLTRTLLGRDVGEAMGGAALGVLVEDDPLPVFARSQAVLDFTVPAATVLHAELAAQARLVHVVGTTGLEREHLERLAAAARQQSLPVDHLPLGELAALLVVGVFVTLHKAGALRS